MPAIFSAAPRRRADSAFVNSLGSLGGVVAPNVLAYARQASGSFSGSLFALAMFALLTGILATCLKRLGSAAAQSEINPRAPSS